MEKNKSIYLKGQREVVLRRLWQGHCGCSGSRISGAICWWPCSVPPGWVLPASCPGRPWLHGCHARLRPRDTELRREGDSNAWICKGAIADKHRMEPVVPRALCCSSSQGTCPRSPVSMAALGEPGWVCEPHHEMWPWRGQDTTAARVWAFGTSILWKMGQKLVCKNTPGKLHRLKLEVRFYI